MKTITHNVEFWFQGLRNSDESKDENYYNLEFRFQG